jgi:hypothetical protein
VALRILASVGVVDAALAAVVARELTAPVLGGGLPLGQIRLADGILP